METGANDPTRIDMRHMRTCARCGRRYDWRRSPSPGLKMTYCGSLCERAGLGFTLEAALELRPARSPAGKPVSDILAEIESAAERAWGQASEQSGRLTPHAGS